MFQIVNLIVLTPAALCYKVYLQLLTAMKVSENSYKESPK